MDATTGQTSGSPRSRESLSNQNLNQPHPGATTHPRTRPTTKHGETQTKLIRQAEDLRHLITNLWDDLITTTVDQVRTGEVHPTETSTTSPATSLGTRTLEVQVGIIIPTTEKEVCRLEGRRITDQRIGGCGEEEVLRNLATTKTLVGPATLHNETMLQALETPGEASTEVMALWEALDMEDSLDGDLPLPANLHPKDGKDKDKVLEVLEEALEVISGMETAPPWEEGTSTNSMMEQTSGEEKQEEEINLGDQETGDGKICRYRISLAVPPDPPAECPQARA